MSNPILGDLGRVDDESDDFDLKSIGEGAGYVLSN
jgi:hypothetical protein